MLALPRRTGLHLALLALLWTLLGVGAAGPALAHTELTSSSPANGSVLTAAPTQARLVFSEQVSPDAAGFGLRNTDGTAAELGTPYRKGTAVLVPIENDLAPGGYLLTYRVVSDDDHPVKGTIAFRVRG